MNCSIQFLAFFSLYFTLARAFPTGDNDDTDNQPEPAISQRKQGDLSTAGTFPINVYANSPYGQAGGLYGSAFGFGNGLSGLNNFGGYSGINSLGINALSGLSGLSGLGGFNSIGGLGGFNSFNSYGLGGGYGGGYGIGNYGAGTGYGIGNYGAQGAYGVGGNYGGAAGVYGLGNYGAGSLYSGSRSGGKLLKFLTKLAGGSHYHEGQGFHHGVQGVQSEGFPGGAIPLIATGGGLGSYGYGFGNQFGGLGGIGGINPYAGAGIVG